RSEIRWYTVPSGSFRPGGKGERLVDVRGVLRFQPFGRGRTPLLQPERRTGQPVLDHAVRPFQPALQAVRDLRRHRPSSLQVPVHIRDRGVRPSRGNSAGACYEKDVVSGRPDRFVPLGGLLGCPKVDANLAVGPGQWVGGPGVQSAPTPSTPWQGR